MATVPARQTDMKAADRPTDGATPLAGDEPLPMLLTVVQLARLLGFTTKGVYSLVENRRIPFVRVSNRIRFLRDDVLAWLRENRVPAVEE